MSARPALDAWLDGVTDVLEQNSYTADDVVREAISVVGMEVERRRATAPVAAMDGAA